MIAKHKQGFLLAVPVALLLLSVFLGEVRGPYYLGDNSDPEYCYLLNSLNILTLHSPAHTDHPGTTLQELGVIVILARWIASGQIWSQESLPEAVLREPEQYLHSINLALNVLFCVFLYLAGRSAFKLTGRLATALTLQVSFVLLQQILLAQIRVSPEPLLMVAALALMLPLMPTVMGRDPSSGSQNPRLAVVAGAVFGFGVVSKVTFLPLASMALLFAGARQKVRFALAAAASVLVLTLPIVTQFGRVLRWLLSLLTHKERYGGGDVGLPDAPTYLGNVRRLYSAEPLLFVLLGIYLLILVALAFSKIDAPNARMLQMKQLLVAGCIAGTAMVAITGKHPAAHYLLPTLAITPLVNAAIVDLFGEFRIPIGLKLAAAAAGLLLCIYAGSRNFHRMEVWISGTQNYREEIRQIEELYAESGKCRLVGLYRSSLPTFALDFGNGFSGRKQSGVLDKLYPNVVNYNIFFGEFQSFSGESKRGEIARLVSEGRCVLVEGTATGIARLRLFETEMLGSESKERVARLAARQDGSKLALAIELPEGAITVQAARFSSGNVVVDDAYFGAGIRVLVSVDVPAYVYYNIQVPTAGRRTVVIRYASAVARALTVRVTGNEVTTQACSEATGGDFPEHQRWQEVGTVDLQAGVNVLRLEREGAFPHVDKIVLIPRAN